MKIYSKNRSVARVALSCVSVCVARHSFKLNNHAHTCYYTGIHMHIDLILAYTHIWSFQKKINSLVRVKVPRRIRARWLKHVEITQTSTDYQYDISSAVKIANVCPEELRKCWKFVKSVISNEELFCMFKDAGFGSCRKQKQPHHVVSFVKKILQRYQDFKVFCISSATFLLINISTPHYTEHFSPWYQHIPLILPIAVVAHRLHFQWPSTLLIALTIITLVAPCIVLLHLTRMFRTIVMA